jgi:methylglyoxal synthase
MRASVANKKQRTAIFFAHDTLKPAMEEVIRDYRSTLEGHYTDFAATIVTAKVIKGYLPEVRALGHGPAGGDIEVIQEISGKTGRGQEVHLYAFLDWEVQEHQQIIDALTMAILKGNCVWFPTPAAAGVYLDAIRGAKEQREETRTPAQEINQERQRQTLQAKADALLAELDAIAESIEGDFDSAEDIRQIRKERTDRL